jgi:hypothetical protein
VSCATYAFRHCRLSIVHCCWSIDNRNGSLFRRGPFTVINLRVAFIIHFKSILAWSLTIRIYKNRHVTLVLSQCNSRKIRMHYSLAAIKHSKLYLFVGSCIRARPNHLFAKYNIETWLGRTLCEVQRTMRTLRACFIFM